MKNKNILLIRKKLDKLDNNLLDIINRRTKLVDQVIKNKKFKKDIVDRKRIKNILKNIKVKSKKKNLKIFLNNQYIQGLFENKKKPPEGGLIF